MTNLSNSSLTIQVPGKLMMAGEFAVLEPYQQLAVMAVNRFVYVDIQESKTNRISLEKFMLHDLSWEYQQNQVRIATTDSRVNFVEEAMSVAYVYLQENKYPLKHLSLRIRSELDDKDSGKKYGLGSSAAVVVGVITAVLQMHVKEKPDPQLVFKLASISHVRAQGNGSGADVAASAYGGILHYSSFQAEWLREQYQHSKLISNLVDSNWQFLSVRPMKLPSDIYLCIGWTGSPASTGNLVKQIISLKERKPLKFQEFLHSSEEAVTNIMTGIENENKSLLFKGIKQNRTALVTVGKEAQTELETPMIKKLCDLAEQHGGAAKQSGAGGGDCGIAFMPSPESAKALEEAWRQEGIIPLDLLPYPNGAKAI
jgi:phosphomevalonate kinase